MDIRKVMAPDEVLVKSYGRNVYLTDMRVIYYTGMIDSYFKDIMLGSIDTIIYTKRHYSWIVALGLFLFVSMLTLSYFLEELAFALIGTGLALCLGLVLVYVFLVDKEVILTGRSSKMELKGISMDFIEDLRKECHKSLKKKHK